MVRCRSQRAPDTVLRSWLRDLANEWRGFGHRRLFVPLRREDDSPIAYRLTDRLA